MNNILSEKEYQRYIMQILEKQNGYVIRPNAKFDSRFAVDREMLFAFLNSTQAKNMEALYKIFGDKTEETVVGYINAEITKPKSSLLHVLKHGVTIANYKLELMYTKPATTYNADLIKKYNQNIFSVMEEVWASDTERVDLVVFLNGFAIMSFELKCNFAGQSYNDAIYQYKKERNPKTRLFLFKAGCLVNFAMDLNEVYMCTRLSGESTYFLPFNSGTGEGVDSGKGNPIYEDKYSVSYMWEDILQKDTVLDLISKFIFLERKEETNEVTGKKTVKEKIVFPRYHQLDVIRKLVADVKINRTEQNYLIQHSAGSGKTNSIAWLAHRLSSLHDMSNRVIFDNIIICTDRVVVDRQLQEAILGIEHVTGLIKVLDDKSTSADLAAALLGYVTINGVKKSVGSPKIIATTIQKFPYIVDTVKALNEKRFAVIIDEAHSSTAGKDMAAITMSLGSDNHWFEETNGEIDAQDIITSELKRNGKQPNVSMFAFTATPKATTLDLFGKVNSKGQKEAFHLYSMKQAIEEGFILDVLANFTEYDTYYRLNKEISEDPKYKTVEAKRQIARFVELHETNIAQRVEVVIEHFRTSVMSEFGGQAKAMVITASRQSAVKYRQAFEEYVAKKGYKDIHALVAFSGKVKLDGDETEYTETLMNGFSEDKLPKIFDKDDYNVLLVANKYQTGFDQPKLCAMYVLKKLRGVNAVQTLSRLNRTCLPWDKKTFILDFVNKYEDIVKAFAPYYTTTLLSNSVTPTAVYDIEAKLDGYMVLDPHDVQMTAQIVYGGEIDRKAQNELRFYMQRAEKKIKENEIDVQREIVATIRSFIRFYEFLIQATCFEDVELHKKYLFLTYLVAFINISNPGAGFDLSDKIKADNFVQKKGAEHKTSSVKVDPVLKLPIADDFHLTEDKVKRLSEIIDEINSRTGKQYDSDLAIKAMLQIKDLLKKSATLRESAKVNTEDDFSFPYFASIDDALIEGLSQNQDFFTLLLNNADIKKELLGIFMSEIYKEFRND
ncbi:MAG: type I restriction endonuclease subunit R [Clostridia bacterium]|nr:type I restriction endonuclease subunit R [Clostridia bacterium]MCI9517655.1 type I restriction endonuclease subunit R [Clostridia bacterium]